MFHFITNDNYNLQVMTWCGDYQNQIQMLRKYPLVMRPPNSGIREIKLNWRR